MFFFLFISKKLKLEFKKGPEEASKHRNLESSNQQQPPRRKQRIKQQHVHEPSSEIQPATKVRLDNKRLRRWSERGLERLVVRLRRVRWRWRDKRRRGRHYHAHERL